MHSNSIKFGHGTEYFCSTLLQKIFFFQAPTECKQRLMFLLLNINSMPSCRLSWPWLKVWPLLLSQTSLCSVVWKYVVCLPVIPIMFNIYFYGFASTGFFPSVCLLLSFKILQDCRIFMLHLCVQGALPLSLYQLLPFFILFYLFLFSHFWVCF